MSTVRVFDEDDDAAEPVRPVAVTAAAPDRDTVPPLPAGYGRPTTVDAEPVPSLMTRTLRLKTLHLTGFVRFLLFEGVIAVTGLLALAQVTSVWTIPAALAAVLVMVKLNDLVATALRRNPPVPRPSVRQ